MRIPEPSDRRQVERRGDARVADLSLPELRRIVVTTALFAVVLGLFLWMVHAVFVSAVLGVVAATYTRPLYRRILGVTRQRALSALLTLAILVLPVLGALVYSYVEVLQVAAYLGAHQDDVAAQLDGAMRRFGITWGGGGPPSAREWVVMASAYGAALPRTLRAALTTGSIGATVFMFTAFYILVDAASVAAYVRGKVPPRYGELASTLERNVRGVLYGAVYGTLVTQAMKSAVILAMNLVFGVPLAVVLAIISFVIGFFPIVGSWSVYVPVAAWLLVFRDALVPAVVMLVIGFLLNTVFISMYVRPKLAAAKSRVLNFYWMFVALIAGVYTFGLPGIILGPILIGLLKAVVDTVTESTSWSTADDEREPLAEAVA